MGYPWGDPGAPRLTQKPVFCFIRIDEKTHYGDFFDDTEMVFYKNITDLSEKIEKISEDEKMRKTIGQKGKTKYMKYFNSTLVADFIINKTYEIKDSKKYL